MGLSKHKLYQEADRLTAKTGGGFVRVNFSAERLQALPKNWSTLVGVAGQIAFKNLDTSQKMGVGGPHSVPGYPVSEALGDHAFLFHSDLRYSIYALPWGGSMQLLGLYSLGVATLNHRTWTGWQGSNSIIKNKALLQSVSLGVTQVWKDRGYVRFMVSRKLGRNVLRDPDTGRDSDNTRHKYRLWLQAVLSF